MSIAGRSGLMFLLALPLLPVAFVFAALAGVFWTHSVLFTLPTVLGLAIRARAEEEGLLLTEGPWKFHRRIEWREIREFRRVFLPPFHSFRAVLVSGEVVEIVFADIDGIGEALDLRRIPFPGRDKPLHDE